MKNIKFATLLIIGIIALLFASNSELSAQDLNEKKKRLEELKEEIQRQLEIIQEKEQDKNLHQKSLNITEQKKRETDSQIENLKRTEASAKQKLDGTIKEINRKTNELSNLEMLCRRCYEELFVAHYQAEIYPEKAADPYLLADLILNTAREISRGYEQKNNLEKVKQDDTVYYEDVVWSRIVTGENRSKIVTEIASLSTAINLLEQEKIAAEERINKLEKESAALDELISKLQSDIISEKYTFEFSTPRLIWPVQGEIIRGYGEQHSAEYKVSIINKGIDIAVPEGTPVVSVDKGVVAFAEWYEGAGKLVIIDHENGYFTLYSHNSSLLVSRGDKVEINQTIALSGKTGSAEVDCLHFEIRKRGNPVNPLDYLEQ
ncbi:MAG: peptidoglycan DD-metalloendopeptidase family protein [Candidatus Cloacimonetes bacterium]|nr:peptidoglycan DD-metalloendopeptidase family protein [Candidatus Cloacimonadota bacterium]